jgi:hypothetical protein
MGSAVGQVRSAVQGFAYQRKPTSEARRGRRAALWNPLTLPGTRDPTCGLCQKIGQYSSLMTERAAKVAPAASRGSYAHLGRCPLTAKTGVRVP